MATTRTAGTLVLEPDGRAAAQRLPGLTLRFAVAALALKLG